MRDFLKIPGETIKEHIVTCAPTKINHFGVSSGRILGLSRFSSFRNFLLGTGKAQQTKPVLPRQGCLVYKHKGRSTYLSAPFFMGAWYSVV
jgi:hypothetical protein